MEVRLDAECCLIDIDNVHAAIQGLVTVSPTADDSEAAAVGESTVVKNVVFAVDTSGSMQGHLAQVISNICLLLNRFDPNTNVAIVTFASTVTVLTGLTKMDENGKHKSQSAIKDIQAEGNTDLCAGIIQSLQLLQADAHREAEVGFVAKHILVFTDGEATVGTHHPESIIEEVKKMMCNTHSGDSSIVLHSFGYGSYHAYELLQQLSTISKSNTYEYVPRGTDITTAFGLCVSSILRTLAVDCSMKASVTALYPPVLTDTLSPVIQPKDQEALRINQQHNPESFDIGNLIAGRKQHYVISGPIPVPRTGSNPELVRLAVEVSYLDPLTGQKKTTSASCDIPVVPHPSRSGGKNAKVCQNINSQKARWFACAALKEAGNACGVGQFGKATLILTDALSLFNAENKTWSSSGITWDWKKYNDYSTPADEICFENMPHTQEEYYDFVDGQADDFPEEPVNVCKVEKTDKVPSSPSSSVTVQSSPDTFLKINDNLFDRLVDDISTALVQTQCKNDQQNPTTSVEVVGLIGAMTQCHESERPNTQSMTPKRVGCESTFEQTESVMKKARCVYATQAEITLLQSL